jgi:DNA-binding transcriptional MerR regulator
MMTINELAGFTGISVRTLHYYDKIDLLKPCRIEENGYRKYNEDSLERLRQILFYKELDLPLKKIISILNQPDFDRISAIRYQKDILTAKRNRLTRLIDNMEKILEGDKTIDFSVFEHNELRDIYESRIMQMDKEYRQTVINRYGSIEAFLDRALQNEDHIKESAIKYYGSIDKYIESLRQTPLPEKGMGRLQLKLDSILSEITDCKGGQVGDPKVQKLVNEWKDTAKKLFKMDDITEVFRHLYNSYISNDVIIKAVDDMYGNGSAVFAGKSMQYNDKNSL